MLLDVHAAYLLASLSVMFGITYTIGKFLDYKITQAKAGINLVESNKSSSPHIFIS